MIEEEESRQDVSKKFDLTCTTFHKTSHGVISPLFRTTIRLNKITSYCESILYRTFSVTLGKQLHVHSYQWKPLNRQLSIPQFNKQCNWGKCYLLGVTTYKYVHLNISVPKAHELFSPLVISPCFDGWWSVVWKKTLRNTTSLFYHKTIWISLYLKDFKFLLTYIVTETQVSHSLYF